MRSGQHQAKKVKKTVLNPTGKAAWLEESEGPTDFQKFPHVRIKGITL